MSESSMLWPRNLPLDQARGILRSPREDGRKRTCRATLQAGGTGSVFSRFLWTGLLSSLGYWGGKVKVVLFSVITISAELAQ